MEMWLQMTLWNTAKYSKILTYDWLMEINLIPNPHGRKFSNEFKGEEIPCIGAECFLIFSPLISVSTCCPAAAQKHIWLVAKVYAAQTLRRVFWKLLLYQLQPSWVNGIFCPFSFVPLRSSEGTRGCPKEEYARARGKCVVLRNRPSEKLVVTVRLEASKCWVALYLTVIDEEVCTSTFCFP